jgi:hypothetical protein
MMACRFLTEAMFEGMQIKARFGELFISDLSAVIVLLVPVEPATPPRYGPGRRKDVPIEPRSCKRFLCWRRLSVCSWLPTQSGRPVMKQRSVCRTLTDRATTQSKVGP